MNAIVPLLVPLFVSAFKRAEDLATAMEVRGYRGGEGRTRYRQLKWEIRDTLCLLSLVVMAVLLLFPYLESGLCRDIKATISYDGTEFSGYQIQPGKRTVQLELERVLTIMHKGNSCEGYCEWTNRCRCSCNRTSYSF